MSHLDYLGGWLCFAASISCIGVMTALIGDLASHFGCTVGLKDTVTAISLVALGTSVPGLLLVAYVKYSVFYTSSELVPIDTIPVT